jgi:hypothetical protein
MLSGFGNLIRDVVNGYNGVEQNNDHENQKEEREIVEKRIAHEPYLPSPSDCCRTARLTSRKVYGA